MELMALRILLASFSVAEVFGNSIKTFYVNGE